MANALTEHRANPEFGEVCFLIGDSPASWRLNWRILPHLVRKLLDALAHAGPGVLVRCRAGRDRTGVISTLLLGHAGVSPEDLAPDHAQSSGHGRCNDPCAHG